MEAASKTQLLRNSDEGASIGSLPCVDPLCLGGERGGGRGHSQYYLRLLSGLC